MSPSLKEGKRRRASEAGDRLKAVTEHNFSNNIRELVCAHEQENEKMGDSWAQELIALLLQALKEVDSKEAPCTRGVRRGFKRGGTSCYSAVKNPTR